MGISASGRSGGVGGVEPGDHVVRVRSGYRLTTNRRSAAVRWTTWTVHTASELALWAGKGGRHGRTA